MPRRGGDQVAASTINVVRVALERPLGHYPQAAVARAKDAVADYLAVTAAARVEPLAQAAERAFAARGRERPSPSRRPPDLEACATAVAQLGFLSHLLDFDDMGDSIRGHPTGPVLSAVLPLAARLGASGAEVLAAYMAAVDGMAIAGRSVATAVQQRGLHPTAVLGALGSTLACSRLLGLSLEQAAGAASLALAQVAGTTANFGTPGKAMQVGLGSAAGCRAALLATDGIVGAPDPVESLRRQSRSEVPEFRVLEYVPGESDWREGGIMFKAFPSCALTHQSIEAAHFLRQSVDAREIVKIRVAGSYRVASMLKYPVPTDQLQAKFSLPYCLAIGLLYDRPLLPRMVRQVLDPAALELAGRVEFEIHPDLTTVECIDREFTEVEVTSRSGETARRTVAGVVQLGSTQAVREKLRQCFALVQKESAADECWETVKALETAASVEGLLAHLY